MLIKVNLEEDAELRSAIKDMVRGQIKSVIREDLDAMIKDELERKLKARTGINFDYLVKAAVDQNVKGIVMNDIYPAYREIMTKRLDVAITEAIEKKDWSTVITAKVSEKIGRIVTNLIDKK